jgi:methyl-accepting chemotaxis protein
MISMTIKQKIALGFASIGLLLLAGTSFFYTSLTEIQTANKNIETLAIPVQQQSNQLQLTLLKMAKLNSQAFSQSKRSELDVSHKAYESLKQEYVLIEQALAKKVQDHPQLQSLLSKAQNHYQTYVQQNAAMFTAKLAIDEAKDKFKSANAAFLEIKTQASNAMIDLEIIDAGSQAALLDDVIATGTRIDDMIYTLGNSLSDLGRLTEQSAIDTHKQDVSFLLSNITSNFDYLKQQATDLPASEPLAVFDASLQEIVAFLQTPGTLYQAQGKVVNQQQLATDAYSQGNTLFSANFSALNELVNLADQRFDDLQRVADDEITTAQTMAIVMAVIFMLMASFIYFFTSKAMLGPLRAINQALALIASGDLSKRLTKTNEDEFGTLMDSMNKLSDDLTHLLEGISRDAHRLDTSAIASQKQGLQISQSASGQISRVNQAKTLVEHINHSSNTVQAQADDAADQINKASELSVQAKGLADNNQHRIEKLSDNLADSVAVMTSLSQHSNNIGGILVTISAIADQTNLLALNAAIEAARAGENGRGFAVVADEVRSLAARTQSSTAEIQNMISALQHETQNAVSAIGQGQSQANECVSQSKTLHTAIEQIENALKNISIMSQSINQAANEQVQFSHQIGSTMEETSQSAEQNAKESTLMAEGSVELNKLAHSLTASVERFKL